MTGIGSPSTVNLVTLNWAGRPARTASIRHRAADSGKPSPCGGLNVPQSVRPTVALGAVVGAVGRGEGSGPPHAASVAHANAVPSIRFIASVPSPLILDAASTGQRVPEFRQAG
ncbi:hypothetical protein Aca07nite_60060 [Actinoplanes capillaceus]|uniref:Uncharacterized protein n=1 Tax=Actinoplanes campanulatus TaxID=113559 RepID=A0ABQ3WRD0_9ACTN|nr:hypothetical protein Aca07nite_60060 [Actinoplanes capillaceus]